MTARILVVDDIPANVKLLEVRLLAEYFEVLTALNGPDAIETCENGKVDVVLLDIMMPDMDGFEVCRRLKSDPATSHIPVVMVTALDQVADRVRGLEAGADDFLTKPVNDLQLMTRVKSLVRLKSLTDELRLRASTTRNIGIEELLSRRMPVEDRMPKVLLVDEQHLRHPVLDRHPPAQQFLDADIAGGGGAQPELVGQRLQPHQTLDARHQLEVVDRLGQKIVGASLQAAHAISHLVERGHHNDRDMRGRRIAFQPAADLEAVHVRHHDIEQDNVDLAVLAGLDGIGPVQGGQHLEILGQQPHFEELHIGGDVVDDEDARCHGGLRNIRKAPASRVAQIGFYGLDEPRHRNRLRDVGLAPALADALLVALHGEGGDGDHRDDMQFAVFLQPFGDVETRHFRQLDVHQDEIGAMRARQVEHFEPVARAHRLVAAGLDQVAKELHVELIVHDDHHFLRHRLRS